MKTRKLFQQSGEILGAILFWCPGCEEAHTYNVKEVMVDGKPTYPNGPHCWEWNGDLEKPTFKPSLLYMPPHPRCHIFITDGVIDFLPDCHHKLAGQKVPMVDIPADSGWANE